MSWSGAKLDKSLEFQKIWSILSRLSYVEDVVDTIPTYITYKTPRLSASKSGKQNKHCMMFPIVILLTETTNNDKYYGIQHGLHKEFGHPFDISTTYVVTG